ncbi:MAG: Asp/Glu racemase [Burkholderia sp.]
MMAGHRDETTAHDAPPGTWRTLPCVDDGGPASAAAIGLLALASDIVIEPELRRLLPREDVGLYTHRIRIGGTLTPESLRALEQDIPEAVARLVPDDRIDVIAFGCTSGAMAIGPDRIAAAIRAARPQAAVTDPVTASLEALRRLGAASIALITPYPDDVNVVIDAYLARHAPPIRARGTFRRTGDPTISRVSPRSIHDAAVALGREPVDAVFISCTALRCAGVIAQIEDVIGKPVVTSNQALAWHALRLAGHRTPQAGQGHLFTL